MPRKIASDNVPRGYGWPVRPENFGGTGFLRVEITNILKLERVLMEMEKVLMEDEMQMGGSDRERGKLRKYAIRLKEAAQARSPYLYGVLRSSHRSTVKTSGGDPFGMVYLDHVRHPVFDGWTDEYGPRLHNDGEHPAWFADTVAQEWPDIAADAISDYEIALRKVVGL